MSTDQDEKPYEVGYGKPPIATRFQPGKSGHPGGRKRGASVLHEIERRLAEGAEFDADGNLVRVGKEACELAEAILAVASGKRDPSEVDVKAALAILDRTDGPVVKERVQTNIQLEEGITLEERRRAT